MSDGAGSSYAAEKAAAATRRAAAFAEAERDYEAWYRDVGTRVEQKTGGYAGVHRGRITTYGPKCYCGRATKALGLCITHYVQFIRARANFKVGRRRRNQTALCHPDRVHHGKGLCRACYTATPWAKAARRARVSRRRLLETITAAAPVPKSYDSVRKRWKKRRAWTCRHVDRPHAGRGLCANCFQRWYRATRAGVKTKVIYSRGEAPLACGHPYRARDGGTGGYCGRCTGMRKRRAALAKRTDGIQVHIPNELRPRPFPCGCADRAYLAKGCCRPCYRRRVFATPAFAAAVIGWNRKVRDVYRDLLDERAAA